MTEADVVESFRQWFLLIGGLAGVGLLLIAAVSALLWWGDRPLSDERLFRIHYLRERNRLREVAHRQKCREIRADAVKLARDEARAGRD